MSRVAIVGGGGAGLLTGWLLQDDHEVVLFEEAAFLGGHAHSVPVETPQGVAWADTGFRYFFPHTYPTFTAVLATIGLAPAARPAGMSFRGTDERAPLTLPPTSVAGALRLVTSPRDMQRALSFFWFLRSGRQIVATADWRLSLRDYLADRRIPRSVAEGYLVPALAALWGAPVEAMFDFPAYDVLRVMQQGKAGQPEFWCFDRGASQYAEALRAGSPGVRHELGAGVRALRRVEGGWQVATASGDAGRFDVVVVATPAYAVAPLFGGPEGHPLARLASEFGHFPTDIVIHRDTAGLPADRATWTNLNVQFDGQAAWCTEWVGRELGADAFRTWLPAGHAEPRDAVLRRSFQHLLVDGRSRARQLEIAALQGRDGIHLAGMYTRDVDNHESVAESAVAVAERLAPGSARLAQVRAARGSGLVRT